jgi:hypothetical protein
MLKPDASEGALPEQGRQARNPRTNAWDNAIESLDGPSCGSESQICRGRKPGQTTLDY